jgi:hypothetical protein
MKTILLSFFALIILTACAAGPDSTGPVSEEGGNIETAAQGSKGKMDICNIVTAKDIESIVGFLPTKLEPSSGRGDKGSGCLYTAGAAFEAVNIVVIQHDSQKDAKSEYEGTMSVYKDEFEPVSGLGSAGSKMGTTYQTYQGEIQATIVLPMRGFEDLDEKAKMIAELLFEAM